jgi:hypothetical protein
MRPMLPWASPLEGLFPCRRGHWNIHRAGRRSVLSVLSERAEARAVRCGVRGRRCLRGPRPTLLASQLGLQVRASLTRPPSWLAPRPAGCPAGFRVPPTRPAPAPEGVSTRGADARYHIQWLSTSWSRGDLVALSPTSPSAPWGSFGETVPVRGPSWSSGASHPRVLVSSSSVPCPTCGGHVLPRQGPLPADPSSRQAEALARSGVAERGGATCPGSPVAFSSCPRAGGSWRRLAGRNRFAVGILVESARRGAWSRSREAVWRQAPGSPPS